MQPTLRLAVTAPKLAPRLRATLRATLSACGVMAACATTNCHAGIVANGENWLSRTGSHLQKVYDQGQTEIFLTGYTWHDPHTYTAAKLAVLNSHAWGLGAARRLVDADGSDEMVYAMMFSDSHRNAEPVVGYAKQWIWRPDGGPFSLGAGYTAGFTSRADILNNIPFPIALPLFSLGIGPVRLYGTYLPRVTSKLNNGNVAFFFASVPFG